MLKLYCLLVTLLVISVIWATLSQILWHFLLPVIGCLWIVWLHNTFSPRQSRTVRAGVTSATGKRPEFAHKSKQTTAEDREHLDLCVRLSRKIQLGESRRSIIQGKRTTGRWLKVVGTEVFASALSDGNTHTSHVGLSLWQFVEI